MHIRRLCILPGFSTNAQIVVLYNLVWVCVRGGVLDVTPLLSGGYYTVPLDSLGIPPVVVLHRVMGVIS